MRRPHAGTCSGLSHGSRAGVPEAVLRRPAAVQGVIVYFRVVDGALRVGDTVKLMRSRKEYQVDELGVLAPKPVQVPLL